MQPAVVEKLTPSAAARLAGVSEQTLRAWLKRGQLPCEQTPLGRLIDPVALGRFMGEREAAQRERKG